MQNSKISAIMFIQISFSGLMQRSLDYVFFSQNLEDLVLKMKILKIITWPLNSVLFYSKVN